MHMLDCIAMTPSPFSNWDAYIFWDRYTEEEQQEWQTPGVWVLGPGLKPAIGILKFDNFNESFTTYIPRKHA